MSSWIAKKDTGTCLRCRARALRRGDVVDPCIKDQILLVLPDSYSQDKVEQDCDFVPHCYLKQVRR